MAGARSLLGRARLLDGVRARVRGHGPLGGGRRRARPRRGRRGSTGASRGRDGKALRRGIGRRARALAGRAVSPSDWLLDLERSLADEEGTEQLAIALIVLASVAGAEVPVDEDEVHGAARRALSLLAAGGGPRTGPRPRRGARPPPAGG